MAMFGMFLLGAGHLAVETFAGINIREQYLQQYLKFWTIHPKTNNTYNICIL